VFLDPTNTIQSQIIAGLGRVTSAVETWLVPLAAIGTVTMAMIQAVKNATPARNWFQRVRLRKWIMATVRGDYNLGRPQRFVRRLQIWVTTLTGESRKIRLSNQKSHRTWVKEVETDLIGLATSGDIDAFYDLAIESLCDQMRKIMSVVLDYPQKHEKLLRCLARGVSDDDLDTVLRPDFSAKDTSTGADPKDPFKVFAAAKGRILVQVRCSVDAIQTSIGFRWKFWLQLLSMILSAILGIIALNLGVTGAGKGDLSGTPEFWTSILIGLLAGFIAPVARDLIAGIEKWRS